MADTKTIRLDPGVHQQLLQCKVLWHKRSISEVIDTALSQVSEVKHDGSSAQAEGNPTDHAELRL